MKLEPGSIIAVPVDGKFRICKVIWTSTRSRNVIGMAVLPGTFDAIDKIEVADGPYRTFTVMGVETTVIYADKLNVTRRKLWPIVGKLPLAEADANLLLQQVGAGLYRGDEYLRNLTPDEYGAYPKLLVAGNGAVENYLREIMSQESGRPHLETGA